MLIQSVNVNVFGFYINNLGEFIKLYVSKSDVMYLCKMQPVKSMSQDSAQR